MGGADCRAIGLQDIKAVHFTLCQKPWSCRPANHPNDTQHLCERLHERWHALRRRVEKRLGLPQPPDDVHCVWDTRPPKYVPLNVSALLRGRPPSSGELASVE